MKSALPKVLHPLLGRSLLSHAMHAVMGLSPEDVVVVVRHDRDAVAAEALRVLPSAVVADQDEVAGTGRAVYCGLVSAAEQGQPLSGTILVTSADVPLLETKTLEKLVRYHEKGGAAVTLVSTIVDEPKGYGRIVRENRSDPDAAVLGIIEHRDATEEQRKIREINAGIYAFDAEFLLDALSRVGDANDQGEVYLTDTVALAVKDGVVAQAFVLQDRWQAEGCNDRWQLAALRTELNRRICEKHAVKGVGIIDPATTSIDVEVTIERDAIIRPFTSLEGTTTVGKDAVVGPHSTVIHSSVGEGAQVPSAYLVGAQIAPAEEVLPFTRIIRVQSSGAEGKNK